MKPAANTSVSEQKIIQPTKTGALLGKLGHLNSTAIAAVAALGLASSVEAQSPIQDSTLLSFTNPAQLSGSEAYPGQNKSRNVINPQGALGVLTEGRTRFTVTTPSAGTLVISWNGSVGTGSNFSFSGSGYAGQPYDVDQLIQWGPSDGVMTTIATLGDDVNRTNDEFNSITSTEGFRYLNQPQSVTLNINAAGTYNFDNVVKSMNTTGSAQVENLQFSFTANSPIQLLDTNTNDIPDTWEMKNLGALAPADADPDHDGQTNMLEYALDTDPMKANPSPITSTIEDGENGEKYLTLSFPRNPLATNLSYTVEGSNDLKLWGEVLEVVNTTQKKVTDTVPISSTPTRFLRLKIEPK